MATLARFGAEKAQYAAPMPTVLVVDDEDVVRDVVGRYLEHEGFEWREAADGAEARRVIEEEPPDLVVLDVMLPEVDGLELCRWIRASHDDLPVILLTARGEEADRIVGLELGADDYVVKPFSPRELVVRVKTVLRRSAPRTATPPARISTGGLEIDRATREVVRDGEVLPLTAIEFDLLWCLASHPRVVFSRAQLLSQVWGYDAGLDGGTSTVTVHVRRLREKIEADPSQPRLVSTVWGVGYRFEP
ncbi:MAG TPA: response regulator transcription factor [Acidimicrobiales bacterium]|nr:response regulator transcription factor [Acidimicrobiales bacterium]